MSQKTINIILVVLLVGGLILGSVALAQASSAKNTIPPPAPEPNQGLGGAFGYILGQIFSGNWFKNLFNKGDNGPSTVNCDPNNKGYELDGTPNPNCGKDYTGCKVGVCDPNRNGYDQCGFLDNNC